MPALPTTSITDPESVCGTCEGSGATADTDGSVTGLTGTLIPCACWDSEIGRSGRCACYLAGWPLQGGFTGWVPAPVDQLADDAPYLRPCPIHNFGALAMLAGKAVAA